MNDSPTFPPTFSLCLPFLSVPWAESVHPVMYLPLVQAPFPSVRAPGCQERTLMVPPCTGQRQPGVGPPHTNTWAVPTGPMHLK